MVQKITSLPKLYFCEKSRKRIEKNHMEKTMNKDRNWDHVVEANTVKEPIEKVIEKKWL